MKKNLRRKDGMKDISIIIPVYNAERTIGKCLEALIHQTCKNFEIICVNDGSTDNSLRVLNDYAENHSLIRVFSQENSGPAKARNFAISKAAGKYLMFCDADDWYEPDMIAEMLYAAENSNADIVMCDCNIIDLANGKLQPEASNNYHKLKIKGFTKIDNKNIKNINIVIWNKIFKRELIEKHGITYPDKFEQDDVIFFYKYLAFARTYYGIDKCLYNYVVGNPASIMGKVFTNQNHNNKFDFIYAWQNFYDYIQTQNIPKSLKEFFIQENYNKLNIFYGKLKKQSQKEAFEHIKNFINQNLFLLKHKKFEEIYNAKTFTEFENAMWKKEKIKEHVTFLQQIFSIKNNREKTHKIVRVAGVKLSFKKH